MKIGYVLTRSPAAGEVDSLLLRTALKSREQGDEVTLFLLADSVWLARKASKTVESLLNGGAVVVASREHLAAAGIGSNELLPGVQVAVDPYETLVDLVMEKLDKVVMI